MLGSCSELLLLKIFINDLCLRRKMRKTEEKWQIRKTKKEGEGRRKKDEGSRNEK